jgi:hypothetical protein
MWGLQQFRKYLDSRSFSFLLGAVVAVILEKQRMKCGLYLT